MRIYHLDYDRDQNDLFFTLYLTRAKLDIPIVFCYNTTLDPKVFLARLETALGFFL